MGEMAPPEIVIVGPGKLGRSLAILLNQIGQRTRLFGRGMPIPPAALTLLTVPDSEIPEAASKVPDGGVVLHASGATPFQVLRPHRNIGSIHPLMTFPGPDVGIPDLNGVPAAISGDAKAIDAAKELAKQLGMEPFEVHGNRALYHAAAVIAGNFTTTLMDISAALLVSAGVEHPNPAALLAPLAHAAINNAALVGPQNALTGPVPRGDEAILSRHREAIEKHCPDHFEIYSQLLNATRALSSRAEVQFNARGEEK